VYPGLTDIMLDYVVDVIGDFCRNAVKGRMPSS
jgi:hypothetical protein